ncbi:hypothetical protein KYI13_12335 (plasmid) [Macrococcoides bohemicum]|uniref:hypothetical protein n=1 Tax=Macrococcoides bohemicum TaxID=1903056 RepID=UPI001C5E3F96|nr:hypothetical protein [Macrococcus bohemicus]QYA46074.1 hypothetical protein KYI13_12335 [Macrococcus bohemicus]
MKKRIFTTTILLSFLFSNIIISDSVEASRTNFAEENLKLPDLSNKKIIDSFYNHSFKYRGITTDYSKKYLLNKWGNANEVQKSKVNKIISENFIYGKNKNVVINVVSNSEIVNSSKVLSMTINDKNSNYKFSELYPLYKDNFQKVQRNNKIYLSNDYFSITFEKKYKTYYATKLSYYSYSSFLE